MARADTEVRVSLGDREGLLGTLMLAPAFLYIAALVGIPFFLAIALSLSSATIGDPHIHGFVGLANFAHAMHESAFPIALRNSIIVTCATLILTLVLATAESELLVRDFRGKWLWQILLILPWAMPVSLAAVDWLWLLDSEFSPLDWLLRQAHLLGPGTPWGPANHLYYYGREWLGLGAITMINVWRLLPLATIIVLAGRTAIPREIFEQAQVDGAGFFRVLFRITIPALLPLLVVAGMFTALLVFGDMTVVALTTRGGPGYATQLLPYWAYLKGIEGGALSEGAAVALFMFPVLLAGAVLALRMAYRADSN
ncbi:MAG: sugar ABC transporter permease [Rhodanobacter sp.]|nr:MAG: sugar ABC transporter permease [Rhodanobacter sp.]TAN25579.1 MAG: sugar ABC transporter permease [Rhodanobacter sp.]